MMAPAVDSLAASNIGRALITKLNTDFNQNTAREHSIQGIPTSMVFSGNAIVARQSGAMPEAALTSMLDKGFLNPTE
jgi:thioredoxin-like negative regulator of GroEL